MQGELVARPDRKHAHVVHLPDARHAERGGMGAFAHSRIGLHRLDVDDDVGLGQRRLERALDRVGGGVALADRCVVRHADHDVREHPPGSLPHPQATQLDRRHEPAIAARAAVSASVGTRSIRTSTLPRIRRTAAMSTMQATKSAAIESAFG